MDWIDFVSLMKYMVDTYGVSYGYGDEDHEFEYPKTEEDCEDAWFECPECGEILYFDDWKENWSNFDLDDIYCPICEEKW